jgi:glucose/arabinose dehydrogenase
MGRVARGAGLAACLALAGCYGLGGSSGGGEIRAPNRRPVVARDVAVPSGFTIEAAAQELTFPTAVAFDDAGGIYVAEAGYSYGERFTVPRLLRIERDGTRTLVASGTNAPWTGMVHRAGTFYVAEGGAVGGGRILAIDGGGRTTVLVDGLPSLGDHHTNGPAVGPDGWLYFGVGTATNAGVVGADNADFGWLRRHRDFHDVPCRNVTVRGVNFTIPDPLSDSGMPLTTGVYSPLGTATSPGQTIAGRVPCSGAIMRTRLRGGRPELVAWGFRNPFGLAFAPDGRLYVTENGFDQRGSRPVFGVEDVLWAVESGRWYGWPDHAAGRPVDDPRYEPPSGPGPERLLAEVPDEPPAPVAHFGVHSSADGLDFSRGGTFGYAGQAFVAQFGDMAPDVGKVMSPVGYKVVRVDVATGVIHDFAVNRGRVNGPASWLRAGGLERPVAVRFDPASDALYVVDFGVVTMTDRGPAPVEGTGVRWRIARAGGAAS